jgi:alkylation response protein AidB-like acyl-CoA dehydrogenase
MADFRFSPAAEAFRMEVIAWLDRLDPAALASHADPGDLTGLAEVFERSLHAEAGEWGWLDLPAEMQAVFNFEAARADAPVIDTAMTLVGGAVSRFAVNDHQRQVLADMAAGRVEACAAYTEPEAGTDLAAMRGSATRHGHEWVLHGTKTLVTGAHKADWCVTVLRTAPDGTAPRDALSMFLIDLRLPGIRIRRLPTLNGWTLGEIELDGARVGPEALLGTEGAGWRQMGAALAAERSGTFWLGFARHVLDLLGRYVCTTTRDGVVLADDPLVVDAIGRLETAWAAADLLSRRALWSQIHDTDVTAATAMAKVVTTELLQDIAQAATEIAEAEGTVWAPLFAGDHIPGAAAGGRFAWEYLERVHATIGAGVNEVHRDAIATSVLGRPTRWT